MKIDPSSSPKALALVQSLLDIGLLRLDSNLQTRRVRDEQDMWRHNHEAERAFLEILISALAEMPGDYFSNINDFDSAIGEYENQGMPLDDRRRNSLRDHLKKYDERVFCYELYHRLRNLMDYRFDGMRLQSEVRKISINPIIESILRVRRLSKEYQPDFLLHAPASSTKQIVIMEVKTDPNLTFNKAKNDLSKLQEFIENYKFKMGVFLAVNVDKGRIVNSMRTESSKKWVRDNIIAANSIYIVCKERPGDSYFMKRLSELTL